jgi:DNA repair photolyase
MILSASRRTDIPAYFSDWFLSQLNKGEFIRTNPFNPKQQSVLSVSPETVDVIVFWTKNPAPLLPNLPFLDNLRYRYYFQYTLNHYPELFEPHLPDLASRLATFQRLSDAIGPEKVIWRYDPIIISEPLTPVTYHLETFARLAATLQGYTKRVIISFLDFYPKLRPWIRKLKEQDQIEVYDIIDPSHETEFIRLVSDLGQIAARHNLSAFTCSEPAALEQYEIQHGACIDPIFINHTFGLNLKPKKDPAQRPNCRCCASVDIGTYNTCKSGCYYCYASSFKTVTSVV